MAGESYNRGVIVDSKTRPRNATALTTNPGTKDERVTL